MHPKHVNRDLKKQLFKWMYDEFPAYREHRKNRQLEEERNGGPAVVKKASRSRSPP
jgi:hypothetical protein